MSLATQFQSTDAVRVLTGRLWLLLVLIWLVLSVSVKPTVRKQSPKGRFWHIAFLVLGLYLIFGKVTGIPWLDFSLYPVTRNIAVVGLVLVCAGIAFSIWARSVLGSNWSGSVTIKEGHTLIRRGPYRIVRHPIYTGLLLAMLGSAFQFGLVRSFIGVAVVGFAFWIKLLIEEQFMAQQFGNEYLLYRQQVRALIPFIF
jgi:protein-S-isoprenylcysteine O-methyltransferase